MSAVLIRDLGLADYAGTWQAMQDYTLHRLPDAADQIWRLQHPPVYTLGLAGKPEHLLDAGAIPVVKCDRGGQVTYHGPGQLVVYTLLDLRRRRLGVRDLVRRLEQSVIDLLALYGVAAAGRVEAPGVYVGLAKIAALGLRVRNGCCYHGLSLNVNMDLAPFSGINPCGYPGLAVTQLADLGVPLDLASAAEELTPLLLRALWND